MFGSAACTLKRRPFPRSKGPPMKASHSLRSPCLFAIVLHALLGCGEPHDSQAGTWQPPEEKEQECQSSQECKGAGQTCLLGPQGHMCGTPRSCGEVIPLVQAEYCEAVLPGSVCQAKEGGGDAECQIPASRTERRYVRVVDTTPKCDPAESESQKEDPGTDLSLVSLRRGAEDVAHGKLPC